MSDVIDIVGRRFGRLVVIRKTNIRSQSRHIKWSCICDCGNEISIISSSLKSGNTQSCGCLNIDNLKQRKTHSRSHIPEYHSWNSMKGRCLNLNNLAYHNYGGRGIKVCDRWLNSFENFYEDMGPKPSPKHSIDRVNNDGHYEPSNCKWATSQEQNNNRRDNIIINGRTLQETCRNKNLNYQIVYQRIHRDGWSVEKALNTTARK